MSKEVQTFICTRCSVIIVWSTGAIGQKQCNEVIVNIAAMILTFQMEVDLTTAPPPPTNIRFFTSTTPRGPWRTIQRLKTIYLFWPWRIQRTWGNRPHKEKEPLGQSPSELFLGNRWWRCYLGKFLMKMLPVTQWNFLICWIQVEYTTQTNTQD